MADSPDTCAERSRGIREEFVEVGRFTGAAGGRIKVTRELYDWIVARQYIVQDRLTEFAKRNRMPASSVTQDHVVEGILQDLHNGKYEGESIDLSTWTVKYIIRGSYRDRLTFGAPRSEFLLEKQERYRDAANLLNLQRDKASEYDRRRWYEIWKAVEFHPELLVLVGGATDYATIAQIFPLVTWPQDWTLTAIKNDINFAVQLRQTKIRGRKRTKTKTKTSPKEVFEDYMANQEE